MAPSTPSPIDGAGAGWSLQLAAPRSAAKSPVAPPPKPARLPDDAKGVNPVMNFALKQLQPAHSYLSERVLWPETVQTSGVDFCPKGLRAGRIAVPLHNVDGKLVSYAGRRPGSSPDGKEHYKQPPGSPAKRSARCRNAGNEPACRVLGITPVFGCRWRRPAPACRQARLLTSPLTNLLACVEAPLRASVQAW